MEKKQILAHEIKKGDLVKILGHKCVCTRVLNMTYYMNIEFENEAKDFQIEIRTPKAQLFTVLTLTETV